MKIALKIILFVGLNLPSFVYAVDAEEYIVNCPECLLRYDPEGNIDDHDNKPFALVVHGLNAKPEDSMGDIIRYFKQEFQIISFLFQAPGHAESNAANANDMGYVNWTNSYQEAFIYLENFANRHNRKFFVIAHSMGCLLNSVYCQNYPTQNLLAAYYLAPAEGITKKYRSYIQKFGGVFRVFDFLPSIKIKGLGNKINGGYARHNDLPITAFSGLARLFKDFHAIGPYFSTDISVTVFIDKNDDFIDCEFVEAFLHDANLNGPCQWQLIKLEDEKSGWPPHSICRNRGEHTDEQPYHPGFAFIMEKVEALMVSAGEIGKAVE